MRQFLLYLIQGVCVLGMAECLITLVSRKVNDRDQ